MVISISFKIKCTAFFQNSKLVRLPAELVRWFKPRWGVISSKGRSPLYGANHSLQALKGRNGFETKSL